MNLTKLTNELDSDNGFTGLKIINYGQDFYVCEHEKYPDIVIKLQRSECVFKNLIKNIKRYELIDILEKCLHIDEDCRYLIQKRIKCLDDILTGKEQDFINSIVFKYIDFNRKYTSIEDVIKQTKKKINLKITSRIRNIVSQLLKFKNNNTDYVLTDLATNNLGLDENNNLKILDFGCIEFLEK